MQTQRTRYCEPCRSYGPWLIPRVEYYYRHAAPNGAPKPKNRKPTGELRISDFFPVSDFELRISLLRLILTTEGHRSQGSMHCPVGGQLAPEYLHVMSGPFTE